MRELSYSEIQAIAANHWPHALDPCMSEMIAFARSLHKKMLTSAEPAAWMLECQNMGSGTTWKLSFSRSGAGACNRIEGESHERPLYYSPQREAICDRCSYEDDGK